MAQRRKDVVALYLQGRYQWEIGEALGVDRGTISRDLKAIQDEWRASNLRDFNEAKAKELDKIDHLERVYWLAWERSVMDRETSNTETTTKGGPDGAATAERVRAGIRRERADGSAQFLAGVQWCISKRCAILGLDAPQRVSLNAADIDREIERLLADVGPAGQGAATADHAGPSGRNPDGAG